MLVSAQWRSRGNFIWVCNSTLAAWISHPHLFTWITTIRMCFWWTHIILSDFKCTKQKQFPQKWDKHSKLLMVPGYSWCKKNSVLKPSCSHWTSFKPLSSKTSIQSEAEIKRCQRRQGSHIYLEVTNVNWRLVFLLMELFYWWNLYRNRSHWPDAEMMWQLGHAHVFANKILNVLKL